MTVPTKDDETMRRLINFPLNVDANREAEPQLTIIETSIALVDLVGIILIISHLTYKFIEAPMRLKSRSVVF